MATISAAHSAAARSNGSFSNGPATAEGKARSSQNARKHSIFVDMALLSTEDSVEFNAVLASFLKEHAPSTATECRFVREMADSEFRLRRIRAYAASLHEKKMQTLSEAPTEQTAADAFHDLLENHDKSLALLLRYEKHFQNQFTKSLQLLIEYREYQARHRSELELRRHTFANTMNDATESTVPAAKEEPKSSNDIGLQKEPIASPRSSASPSQTAVHSTQPGASSDGKLFERIPRDLGLHTSSQSAAKPMPLV